MERKSAQSIQQLQPDDARLRPDHSLHPARRRHVSVPLHGTPHHFMAVHNVQEGAARNFQTHRLSLRPSLARGLKPTYRHPI
jgi:hypothetical protein